MSRLIVIALLAINLGLLGYDFTRAAPPAPPDTHVPSPEPPDRDRWADAPRIQLMSEMPDTPVDDPDRQCFSLGPFETMASRTRAREGIGDFAAVAPRESEALVELGYWVTLPSYPSMADAVSGMQELIRAGLHDIAVVSDETGDYSISLGYFLQEANARGRRDRLRELGYEAETRLQREAQPRYWLDLERPVAASGDIPAGIDESLLRPIPCGARVAAAEAATTPPTAEPADASTGPADALPGDANAADTTPPTADPPVPAGDTSETADNASEPADDAFEPADDAIEPAENPSAEAESAAEDGDSTG